MAPATLLLSTLQIDRNAVFAAAFEYQVQGS